MEQETTLGRSIRSAGDHAKLDASCKRLLSEKSILAWIMKSCLAEYQGLGIREIAETYIEGDPRISAVPVLPDEPDPIIHGAGQEDASPTEGTISYDIHFDAIAPDAKTFVQLIINIETQNDYYPGYPLTRRGVYYCGRLISGQHGKVFTKSHYEKLRKVYSIWICTNPPASRRNTITRYRMTEENVVGTVKEDERNYDLMTVIMICLGKDGQDGCDGILKLLAVLLSTNTEPAVKKQILEKEFEIPMTETLESEVSLMCNLSIGVERKGMEKGILLSARSLMKNTGWSAEKALAVLEVPEGRRVDYARQLSAQPEREAGEIP